MSMSDALRIHNHYDAVLDYINRSAIQLSFGTTNLVQVVFKQQAISLGNNRPRFVPNTLILLGLILSDWNTIRRDERGTKVNIACAGMLTEGLSAPKPCHDNSPMPHIAILGQMDERIWSEEWLETNQADCSQTRGIHT
jgi:hypothetical protein